MNKIFYISLIIFCISCENNNKAQQSEEISPSFALGYQQGQSLKQREAEIDSNEFHQGFLMAQRGEKLDQKKFSSAMKNFATQQSGKLQKIQDRNLSKSREFLEKNLKNGVKSTQSGLQYKIVKEGQGPSPAQMSVVEISYSLTVNDVLIENTDSLNKYPMITINSLPRGVQEGLRLIGSGGEIQLFVPPNLGYGSSNRPNIPPNSVLTYNIKLKSFK